MYHLVYGFLYLVSMLPMSVLYVLGDIFYGLIYYLIGYRKQVVMQNLTIAFPQKSQDEKTRIAKQFYRNFIDTFLETIKLISASDHFLKKHAEVDTSILQQLHRQGKKCQIHLGHNFNWELANLVVPYYSPYLQIGIYMPLTNKLLDRIFLKIRSRNGVIMLPATSISRAMIPYRNEQYLMALIADQNPGVPAKAYWFEFFGRPTPFVTGPEKNARANEAAVVFAHLTKKKRGYYRIHFELATADPQLLEEKALTRIYVRFLEKVIRDHPEMWLWSHRRWKHQWNEEYGKVESIGQWPVGS